MKRYMPVMAITATALLSSVAGSPAQADPSGTAFRTYAAVGSDTTEGVWNGLTGKGGPITTVDNWNSVGSATIKTKSTGTAFARPAGSGDGVKALSASVDPANNIYQGVNIKGQVDIARSSSAPSVAGSTLKYLPFTRDAVTAVVNLPSGVTGTVNLTTDDLKKIYTCAKTSVAVKTSAGNKNVTVKPKLPQASSGTRKFFLAATGVATPGSCVKTVGAENDGAQAAADGDIIPFSAAQIIAQRTKVITNTVRSDQAIASINGKAAVSSTNTPGALYGSASTAPAAAVGIFSRDVYNVIPANKLGTALETTVNKAAKAVYDTKSGKTWVARYGFMPISYAGDAKKYLSSGYSH